MKVPFDCSLSVKLPMSLTFARGMYRVTRLSQYFSFQRVVTAFRHSPMSQECISFVFLTPFNYLRYIHSSFKSLYRSTGGTRGLGIVSSYMGMGNTYIGYIQTLEK